MGDKSCFDCVHLALCPCWNASAPCTPAGRDFFHWAQGISDVAAPVCASFAKKEDQTRPTKDQILEGLARVKVAAQKAKERGTLYDQMSYEEGLKHAIEWCLGEIEDDDFFQTILAD